MLRCWWTEKTTKCSINKSCKYRNACRRSRQRVTMNNWKTLLILLNYLSTQLQPKAQIPSFLNSIELPTRRAIAPFSISKCTYCIKVIFFWKAQWKIRMRFIKIMQFHWEDFPQWVLWRNKLKRRERKNALALIVVCMESECSIHKNPLI